jgi:hypothetical protein
VIRISDQDREDVRRNTFANFTMDATSGLLENVFMKSAYPSKKFMLVYNADMDVTEITAALGCKFVYFTELQINF